MQTDKLPELLAPAGSPEALRAAVAAGADAVYFGAGAYNARMNAHNFDDRELSDAFAFCRAHGVRTNITLNTQIYDRELADALKTVEQLYLLGADALIVADLGLARLIRDNFPDFELHASTQACGNSVRDAEYFASLGFSRMVAARELSRENLIELCKNSPIEIEMFIHGANCVSVSGQCLMSSMIGGRSGNRGLCAQPCRLSYNGGYPLSPKDNCLAPHIAEILTFGVSSLKIEGRMKSPDYVYRVVSVYRRLLDERRSATAAELRELSSAFSRSGFTDGFFTGDVKKHPNAMLGVRTDSDKAETKKTQTEVPSPSPVKITSAHACIVRGVPSRLTFATENKTVSVEGAVPDEALTRPLTEASVRTQLSKLGSTPFYVEPEAFEITLDDGLILPVSALNELRRRAVLALSDTSRSLPERTVKPMLASEALPRPKRVLKTAEFPSEDCITDLARSYFDIICLPLDKYSNGSRADGVILPAVIYGSEEKKIKEQLTSAASNGASYAFVANAGQLALTNGFDFEVSAAYRANVSNSHSAKELLSAGVSCVTLSPELTAPMMRDIAHFTPASVIVYGRIPLMTTERCIIRAVSGDKCVCKTKKVSLRDRMGANFPILPADGCRSIIYNSVPVYMADKRDTLDSIGAVRHHFIFSTETPGAIDEIITAYKTGAAAEYPIRRIK